MVKLSRFAHSFDLGDSVAMYHSLRMKPVFLKREQYEKLRECLANSSYCSINDFPDSIQEEMCELAKYKIITQSPDEDERVLSFIKSISPKPAISVCYMILSEQCNLACKYCFLGNNDPDKRARFSVGNMTEEMAEKAIDFFIRQIRQSDNDSPENHPVVIFYGGEPLLNFPVLDYVASRINEMKAHVDSIKNVEMSVITNGVLLDRTKLLRLQELGVSIAISVDGCTEQTNEMRVDRLDAPVFPRIISVLDECKELGVDISLSVTLTEETVKNPSNVLALIDQYGIKGFGFNILMPDESFSLSQDYNEEAARFIIDSFIELRDRGVYEDRMMRKLKAFSKAQVYFSDCAATSGSQIVIAPDGRVGICHGCLSSKEFFVSTIFDDEFNATENSDFVEWSKTTPIHKPECLSCAALGICGGGCPVNAMQLRPGNTIHSLDERFCVHAKETLEFLISDLYRIITKEQ